MYEVRLQYGNSTTKTLFCLNSTLFFSILFEASTKKEAGLLEPYTVSIETHNLAKAYGVRRFYQYDEEHFLNNSLTPICILILIY